MTGLLRLNEAVPELFGRVVPTVEQGTFNVIAGTLLDIPRREVLLISSTDDGVRYLSRGGKWMAFAGYPLLEMMLATEPKDLYRLLFQPCESASVFLDPVRSDGVAAVLDAFQRTRFGYALVESAESFGMVTLADALLLYQEGLFSTGLRLRDVASSPVFSLPGSASLREAVRQLFRRRVRRVRVEGSNRFVSDREILAYLFSPARLRTVKDAPEKMLEATLQDAGGTEAVEADGGARVKNAADAIKPGSGVCLTVEGGAGVVTPWDLVMKPWEAGELKMARGARP
ncbi:MAG: CBS domain-containing protein [Nitrososphaerota archaeon]|nr:CBS domain-containing protein [Nitrososphaerota archaeon]